MTPGRLPRHPQPIAGESLSSWLIRTATANAERLSYITTSLTGDPNFWKNDPDRRLSPELAARLTEGTGVREETLQRIVLSQHVGTLFPHLSQQGSPPWVLPLAKRGYRLTRRGSLYCPDCLAEDAVPHLRLHWRLSFVTTCARHATLLRDACPHCAFPFAPHLNDLGIGKDWRFAGMSLFGWCPACEGDLRVPASQTDPAQVEFQRDLLCGSVQGALPWSELQEVVAVEGFSVLHQLLSVLTLPEVRDKVLLPDAPQYPYRRNRSFEDFSLDGRHALLTRLAYLVGEWPRRLTAVAQDARLTRRPLVFNMTVIPPWYDQVADQFSRANGRRAYKLIPLMPYLSLVELARRRETAKTEAERRRWDILWHYAQHPQKKVVARKLGLSWELVHLTVKRYNTGGPEAVDDPRRGRPNRLKRLLTEEQERDLRHLIDSSPARLDNERLAAWFMERIGKRPDSTTLWIYRRGVEHSREGRRAK